MNITPVTLPSWVPFFMTGVVDDKNGRETGERTDYPPVPSALCKLAFELCDGTKGGIFSNSSFFSVWLINRLPFVRRIQTLSPTGLDSQSVTIGLLICIFQQQCHSVEGIVGACLLSFHSAKGKEKS